MTAFIMAIGLVFVIEGLVLALAPARLDKLLEELAKIPVDTRRLLGLLGVTMGLIIAWTAASL